MILWPLPSIMVRVKLQAPRQGRYRSKGLRQGGAQHNPDAGNALIRELWALTHVKTSRIFLCLEIVVNGRNCNISIVREVGLYNNYKSFTKSLKDVQETQCPPSPWRKSYAMYCNVASEYTDKSLLGFYIGRKSYHSLDHPLWHLPFFFPSLFPGLFFHYCPHFLFNSFFICIVVMSKIHKKSLSWKYK